MQFYRGGKFLLDISDLYFGSAFFLKMNTIEYWVVLRHLCIIIWVIWLTGRFDVCYEKYRLLVTGSDQLIPGPARFHSEAGAELTNSCSAQVPHSVTAISLPRQRMKTAAPVSFQLQQTAMVAKWPNYRDTSNRDHARPHLHAPWLLLRPSCVLKEWTEASRRPTTRRFGDRAALPFPGGWTPRGGPAVEVPSKPFRTVSPTLGT